MRDTCFVFSFTTDTGGSVTSEAKKKKRFHLLLVILKVRCFSEKERTSHCAECFVFRPSDCLLRLLLLPIERGPFSESLVADPQQVVEPSPLVVCCSGMLSLGRLFILISPSQHFLMAKMRISEQMFGFVATSIQ